MRIRIESSCAACRRAIVFDLDDRLRWTLRSGPTSILVFEPDIEWSRFRAPTIVHDY